MFHILFLSVLQFIWYLIKSRWGIICYSNGDSLRKLERARAATTVKLPWRSKQYKCNSFSNTNTSLFQTNKSYFHTKTDIFGIENTINFQNKHNSIKNTNEIYFDTNTIKFAVHIKMRKLDIPLIICTAEQFSFSVVAGVLKWGVALKKVILMDWIC